MLKWIYLIKQQKQIQKNGTGVDTSKLSAKSDLASLKAKVDKTDADKLKTVPVIVSKLSNAVNNDAATKNCL